MRSIFVGLLFEMNRMLSQEFVCLLRLDHKSVAAHFLNACPCLGHSCARYALEILVLKSCQAVRQLHVDPEFTPCLKFIAFSPQKSILRLVTILQRQLIFSWILWATILTISYLYCLQFMSDHLGLIEKNNTLLDSLGYNIDHELFIFSVIYIRSPQIKLAILWM